MKKKLLQLGKGSKKMRCFKKVSKHKKGMGSLCQPKFPIDIQSQGKLYINFPWAKAVQRWAIFQKVNKPMIRMGTLCQTDFWIESQSQKFFYCTWAKAGQKWAVFQKVNKHEIGMGSLSNRPPVSFYRWCLFTNKRLDMCLL